MKYDIFISYRREGGYDTAKHLNDLLVRDGYRVSFDIDTLRSGDFDIQLLERIDQCNDFILIVDQHCFDRTLNPCFDPKKDWLRCELAYALKKGKNIIPVFLAGVKGFPEDLPDDLKNVVMKNGPEFNRYHFNSFYNILKDRFLHKLPFYRQKRNVAFLLAFVLLLLFTIILFSMRYNGLSIVRLSNNNKESVLSNKNINHDNEDSTVKKEIATKVEENLPDYKTQVREKFENMPDLEPADRADIVDVIKSFLKNTNKTTCPSWGCFSAFTKEHLLVPLSQGIEWEKDDAILPFRLDFIAKLTYKGKNLDSNLHGQSCIQEIYLGGPRAGATILVISSGIQLSYEIGENVDDIIKDAGFRVFDSKRYMGTSYDIYKNSKDCFLVLAYSGGSGGNSYEWIISYDQNTIVQYLDKLDIFNLSDSDN